MAAATKGECSAEKSVRKMPGGASNSGERGEIKLGRRICPAGTPLFERAFFTS
jgi:hypothetical protein